MASATVDSHLANPLANLLQHSLNRFLSLVKTTLWIAENKSSLSEVSRKRVLNTTQPSNNDNHTEHLSTDPTCLKLQNELQVYVRQEAIKDHLHLMKLDDSKDDPEVNINTAALREVKIEAAHGAMAKIEQRSNGAVTLFVFSSPWTKDRLAPKFNLVTSDQFNRELKLWCTIIENTTGQQTGKAQPTVSRKAESLESIGLLTRINWPAWAPAMRLALQSISAFRVATGEQKKPPASQPPNQSLKDYTSLCNDYDAKDAKGRTLIRSHVDENTWFKLKGSAVGASLHQVWTGLVRAYETNSVPFVGTKTLRAYWNLRYEPGTSVTSFMTEVERLGELCNRQKMSFWKQQLGIGTEELQGFYAQIVDILGEERGKALLSMVLHVDDFAIKTVLMEQLPEKYTFAFREEKDVDLFLEKVRTAYDEDVIMNGANDKEQTEAPASAFAAARQEADPGQAPPCNGNCACGQQPHAFATAGQPRGHAGPTRNSYRSGGHGRTGTRVGAKTRAEHYANSDKWGKIVDGKFITLTSKKKVCGRLWWTYQHTVVSAAPACGVGVTIRSHVQALW
ncbi:BQ5605_C004g02612 [Microbotryum silenes-dioicae]|uniref:BQ5605_C004g02612 protein n=1 Tax=Microbotryum silenes-dioicae TaxID=796604 RepID=A0A2X0MVF1_9BASI|nr:BQ5605_C004g02612 [Microbotryum silenes-dioicae]